MQQAIVFRLGAFILIGLATAAGIYLLSTTHSTSASSGTRENATNFHHSISRVTNGHWEYVDEGNETISQPYTFSRKVCEATGGSFGDCNNPSKHCLQNLMNYAYFDSDGKPYPQFNVHRFRRQMRNKRILFLGPSMIRQQVQALVWTLGHDRVNWEETTYDCTSKRKCMVEEGNITICDQFMGSAATKIYHEGNFTLDHSKRGHGDSSCLLREENLNDMGKFDLVIIQSISWWTNLANNLGSSESPPQWVNKMIPTIYYDTMEVLLSSVSQHAKTVLVLGQIGTRCKNKTAPEPYLVEKIPNQYGWGTAPKLWDTSLNLIQERA